MSVRVVIAEDSALFRRLLTETLAAIPGIQVIGSAVTGDVAVDLALRLRPDVMTLDLEMPGLDGLGVLDALRGTSPPVTVLVVSALTVEGGELTMKALAKGAFDFITKPEGAGPEESREMLRRDLETRLGAISGRLGVRRVLSKSAATRAATVPAAAAAARTIAPRATKPEMVVIGVSTGGPQALDRLLPALPGDLGIPLLVVQHMPPMFTASLARSLAAKSRLAVKEAAHGEEPVPNTVYIAPGGRQMRLAARRDRLKEIQITDDPPENHCRPAADYLFRSVAEAFPGKAAAVILTGMGTDGARGLALLRSRGSYVIAQDEATSVVYGMARAAVEAGAVDVVLPLESIAAKLTSIVRGAR